MAPEQSLVPTSIHKNFEDIKKVSPDGYEYWDARELMPLMGYSRWEDFHKAIKRAQVTCISSGQNLKYHFRGAPKMIIIAKGTAKSAERKIADYQLSRFACYLVAQNGDPRKPEIAFAQTYFAVQTRRQELFQSLDEPGRRLYTRQEVVSHNKQLFDTAKQAGVENFGKFNNAGYLGLYGLTAEDIQHHKGIGKDNILDRAGSTELAANLFRITQTDAKLKKDGIQGEGLASKTHYDVGRTVRETIEKIGGTMPEDLPPEEHIGTLLRRQIGQLPKPPKRIGGKKVKK
jgi:DNA-damage-inducible protein D